MIRRLVVLSLCISITLSCISCSNSEGKLLEERNVNISSELSYSHSMETVYARKFTVDYYEDNYALISIADGSRFLLVPKDQKLPEDLEEGIVPLIQPVEHIYLVASAVMDMFVSLDALDKVRFSGLKADGWYIEEAREAVESGEILYAGNYAAPDYEQIISEDRKSVV